jgi:diguanylate cyclase (GGDEF)-like protein/PAS domain S-box-containing protein
MNKRVNKDRQIFEPLRDEASQLEALEQRIRLLEKERDEFEHTKRHLTGKIEELEQTKNEWEWFFENSLEMLCIAGTDGYFKRVNPAFVRNLGYTKQQLISRPFIEFVHPDDKENTLAEAAALGSGKNSVNFENRYLDGEGNWRWMSWHCPAITDNANKLYAIARDITERKQYDAEILYRAMHDPLTDLFNRAVFEDKLSNAVSRCKRIPGSEIVLYLVDLDGFKNINDTYGHPTGDKLLKQLGKRFKQIQRDYELVCRLGGDEFAWLVDGVGSISVEPLAERILEMVTKPVELDEATVNVGCSIGITKFPNPAVDADALVAQADAALYSVKKSGKRGYKIFNAGQD